MATAETQEEVPYTADYHFWKATGGLIARTRPADPVPRCRDDLSAAAAPGAERVRRRLPDRRALDPGVDEHDGEMR